jgi:hypothetical protein
VFELRLKDLSEDKRNEMLDTFVKRKELREYIGGCPHDKDRVPEHTQCFNCNVCWIAAIENSFREEK